MRITIYDTDGGNPYGRELADLLTASFSVKTLIPADVEWTPASGWFVPILPANGPAALSRQLIRLFRGLIVLATDTLVRKRIAIVVMTRDWYDNLALGLIGVLGAKLIVIAHDPLPKKPLSPIMRLSRGLLWRSATKLVSHSDELRLQAEAAAGRTALSIPHLPFACYSEWCKTVAPNKPANDISRLLILGQLRPDKGLHRIPAILDMLPKELLVKMSILFAGRGSIDSVVERTAARITVTRRNSTSRLSDMEIAHCLAESDVLIAPYPTVSASGSIVLALSRGLGVIAYDTGAISDVLADDGLVPPQDENAFAQRIATAHLNGGGTPREPIANWRKRSFRAWYKVICER